MTIYKNAIGGDHQAATFIVAASDSQHPEHADFVCKGIDDDVTIQEAIDAVELGGGSDPQHHGKSGAVIMLMPGRYSISDIITIERNIFLMGSGFTATEINLADNSDCGMINFTNYQGGVDVSYGAGVSNLRLDGNKANQTGDWSNLYGLLINASDAYFDHIWIDDCGVGLESSSLWSTYFNQISIEECTRGVYFNAAADNHLSFLQFHGMNVHQKFEMRSAASNSYAKDITIKDSNLGIGTHEYDSMELEGNIYDCTVENCKFNGASAATYFDMKLIDSAIGNPTNIQIVGNRFPSTSGAGNIDLPVGCDYNMITRNKFSHATPFTIAVGGNANGMIYRNRGYVTENSGTTIIYDGNTSRDIAHGLSKTPANGDIMVTCNNDYGSATYFWIGSYTSTHFTINIDQVAGQSLDLAWRAIVL